MDRVDAVDLGVEVLVAGLDGFAQTQLFSVCSRGIVSPAALRYHAIGSGAPVALGHLYPLQYFPTHELAETVYWACAAKFAAEITPSVGQSTYAIAISPLHGTWTLVSDIERLRELWKSKGRPPVPGEARKLIQRDSRRLDFDGRPSKRGAGWQGHGVRDASSEPIWTEYEAVLRRPELKLQPAEVERTLTELRKVADLGMRRRPRYGALVQRFRAGWRVQLEKALLKEMVAVLTAAHIVAHVIDRTDALMASRVGLAELPDRQLAATLFVGTATFATTAEQMAMNLQSLK